MSWHELGTRELAREIASSPGGGTWHVGSEHAAEIWAGYVVGGVCPSRTVAPDVSRPDLAIWDACHGILADARELGAAYVGWWTDELTGTLWLDVVDVVDELGTALTLARQRGELAVWDAAQGAELRVTA